MKNLERHRQALEAAQVGHWIPAQLLRLTSQAQMRQALQQRANSNLTFQARQWCPQTVMDAFTKGQVLIDLACDIERFWIRKLLRIRIGSAQRDPHQFALAYHLTMQRDILEGPTRA